MRFFPFTIRARIIIAFSACFLFMAFLVWTNFRLVYLLVFFVLLALVVYWAGWKTVRPLTRLFRESEKMTGGNFSEPLNFPGGFDNKIEGLVRVLNQLISQRQHRQNQLISAYKDTVMGTLTPGIVHEINNSLNNIILTLETLIEDNQTLSAEERLEMFQDALDQTEKAEKINKHLLEVSRSSPSRMELVSVEDLIDPPLRLLKNEFKRNRIKITKEVRGDFPRMPLDKNGLHQVLLYVLLNSVQAMKDGGYISLIATPADSELQVEIKDTGSGISPERLVQVFCPFFTTKNGRTGLGLSISRDILKKQGGRIEVQSSQGAGTTFFIFVPFNHKQIQ